MPNKFPICPDRIRTIPEQFSWVDHRLVRDHHIERLSHQAASLYLFLVTVADCQGLSYYSDVSRDRSTKCWLLVISRLPQNKAGESESQCPLARYWGNLLEVYND